jgi:hypothetical protein
MVRMTLLFALAMVLSALMPRWITHDHDGAHTAVHALAVDAAADHLHADGAGEPVVPLPDGSHAHAHYLAGAPATLPQVIVALCEPVRADACAPWRDASAPDGSLSRLHRPPIV